MTTLPPFQRLLDEPAGLADVAYADLDSPVGPLLGAVTDRGLVTLGYEREVHRDVLLERLAARVSPRVVEAPRRLDRVRRELEEYFEGRRTVFELPVDLRLVRGAFGRRVLEVARTIGFGSTLSYGEIAARAGSPRASRAAGNALGANPVPIVVPCHRIVHASGGIGGYAGGLDAKRTLLRLERREVPAPPESRLS